MSSQIVAYHTKIMSIVQETEATLRSDEPDLMALGGLRWALGRTLGDYQLFKHTRFFDPLLERGTTRQVAIAERMKRACITAGIEYRAFVAEWDANSILDRWPHYRPAALAIMARIRAHIDAERDGLVQLLQADQPPTLVA